MKNSQNRKMHPKANASLEACLASITEYHDSMVRLAKGLKDFELKLSDRLNVGDTNGSQVGKLLLLANDLLRLCRNDPKAKHVPHCLAAIDYFLESNDSIPDFQTSDGFDDDEKIFSEVIKLFNLKLK